MRLRPLPAGLLLAPLLLLGACGDDRGGVVRPEATGSSSTSPSSPPSAEEPAVGSALELRPVVATSAAAPPDSLVQQQFAGLDCDAEPVPLPPREGGAACDAAGTKYSLGPAAVVGGVAEASSVADPRSGTWVVTVQLEPEAGEALAALSAELAPVGGRVALLVDSVVVSAPAVATPITDGLLQIAGGYDEQAAGDLAEALSRG